MNWSPSVGEISESRLLTSIPPTTDNQKLNSPNFRQELSACMDRSSMLEWQAFGNIYLR